MTTGDIEARVRQTLELALGGPIDDGDVSRETDARWDSVKNVELIFLLEDEFGVELTEEDVTKMTRLSDVVQVVEARLAA